MSSPAIRPGASRWLELVGIPYRFPSTPPYSADCWSLVKYVRTEEGLACPLPFDDRADWCRPGHVARGIALALPLWRLRARPEDFDVALLEPGHIGVVIEGGVLHALARNASVVWTPMAAIRRHWPQAQWWTA